MQQNEVQIPVPLRGVDNTTVIIDLSSRTTRAGVLATEFPDPSGPRISVDSVCHGRGAVGAGPDPTADTPGPDRAKNEARPINRGCIEDIDGVKEIIREVLYTHAGWPEQPLPGYNRNIVLVEPPMQSRATRERLTQLMFEEFKVTNYFSIDAAAASLYSIGKTSGIVVDVGYDKVDVTPVLEGVVHASSGARLAGFGGHAMTKMVAKKSGLGYDEAEAKKVGYSNPLNGVAHGGGPGIGQAEANQQQQQQQQQLSLEDMMGEEIASHISDISSACINASMVSLVAGEREWRKTLMEQIFVCGGGSRVPGFGSRVFEDLLEKHSSGFKPGLLSVPEYMPAEHALGCASWYGGHAIAGVVTNPAVVQKQCITRENYQEYGPKAIWKKLS